jgi:hypothetical protein
MSARSRSIVNVGLVILNFFTPFGGLYTDPVGVKDSQVLTLIPDNVTTSGHIIIRLPRLLREGKHSYQDQQASQERTRSLQRDTSSGGFS